MTDLRDSDGFAARLEQAIARHGPTCLGLDPYPERLPAVFGPPGLGQLQAFGAAVIARAAGRVAALKPQIALFERFGPDGLRVLGDLTHRAHDAGLLVLLDAKRGDIADTAAGYAQAYLGREAWLHADAMTVNPYLGADSIAPFVDTAAAHGRGVIVLVRTSNPGAADLQDKTLAGREAEPVWAHTARLLEPFAAQLAGPGRWSGLAAVVGATAPDQARAARALLPSVPFLAPGYGSQGGGARDALAGAVASPTGAQGVIVNASRSVLYGPGDADTPDLSAWTKAFDARLTRFVTELGEASASMRTPTPSHQGV